MRLCKAGLSGRDVDMRMGRRDITLNGLNVTIYFTNDTVPVIDILGVDIWSLRRAWAKIPKWYKLSDNGPWPSSDTCLPH